MMMRTLQREFPLTASTGRITEITGLSATTMRRLAKTDPTFPQPFTINDRGDLKWPVAEVVTWLEVQAGRPLQAA